MKPIVWFKEVGIGDGDVAGGKGANLGELTRAGLPVPTGFIVTAPAYLRFLDEAHLRPAIAAHLAALDATNPQQLQVTSVEIKQLLTAAPVPPEIATAIEGAHAEMSLVPVAVRSSATAEDLAEASFAGQQSTFLNVTGDLLIDSARDCWASLFEPQAIAYRHRRGIDHLSVGIAVVVQRMVQSQRSGVMFTLHPVTGDRDRIVIEAVLGLGEAAVSGVVTPDLYVVNKTSMAIEERHVSHQERQLLRGTEPRPGEENNTWVAVAASLANSQKLSDPEIHILAELALRIEEHYGAPQDIEWAEEDAAFFIVQARPVTTV